MEDAVSDISKYLYIYYRMNYKTRGGRVTRNPLPLLEEPKIRLNDSSKAKIIRLFKKKGPYIFVEIQQGYSPQGFLNERTMHKDDLTWLNSARSAEFLRLQQRPLNEARQRIRMAISQQISDGESVEDIRERIGSHNIPQVEEILNEISNAPEILRQRLLDAEGDDSIRQLINDTFANYDADFAEGLSRAAGDATGSEHIGELVEDIISERRMAGRRKRAKRLKGSKKRNISNKKKRNISNKKTRKR